MNLAAAVVEVAIAVHDRANPARAEIHNYDIVPMPNGNYVLLSGK